MRWFSLMPPYTQILRHVSVKELCPIPKGEYVPHLPPRVSAGYEWEPGDFSCHFSALPIERRTELARKMVDEVHPL